MVFCDLEEAHMQNSLFFHIQGGAVLPNTADLYFAPIKSDGYYEER